MARTRIVLAATLTATLILMASCESRDARLAEYARQATEQQARQNEEMARQSQQVAEQSSELAKTAHSLVEQDATARREMIEAHSKLQSELHDERQGLDTQRQELHVERQEVTAAAIREPVIAQAILVTGLILAAVLPLLVTAYALRRLPDPGPNDLLLADTLIETFEAEHRRLLSADTALDRRTAPRITGPGTESEPGEPVPESPPF